MKKKSKIDLKIEELLKEPMKLDFIPQLKAHLKYIHRWTLDELRDTVEINDDARDTLEEIIDETFTN